MGHKFFPTFHTEGNTLVRYHKDNWKAEVPRGIEIIGPGAFADEEYLETVVLPQGLKIIEASAFHDCYNLTEVNIPDTVTTIGEGAFFGCSKLEALRIPDSVTAIGPAAFCGCLWLKDVNIPPALRELGRGAFSECSELTAVSIPAGIGAIPDYGFQNCDKLRSVTIPEGITAIGERAFAGCGNLTSLTLPESIRSIGKAAFYGCSNLTRLRLPPGAALPDPIGELFEGTSLEILWAPGQSPERLGPWKTQAALGYIELTAGGHTFPPALAEEYEAYIHSCPTEFYFSTALSDLPLRHMMANRHIPRKDAVLLLEMLELEDKFDLKASLLEYLGTASPDGESEPEFLL